MVAMTPNDRFAAYASWARALARRVAEHAPPSFERADLEQEALLALWQCALRFDEAHGAHFSVFAKPYVVGAALMYLRKNWRAATALMLLNSDARVWDDTSCEYGGPVAPDLERQKFFSGLNLQCSQSAEAALAPLTDAQWPRIVAEAIATAPEDCQAAARLVYCDGATRTDARRALRCTASALRRQLDAAEQAIRAHLKRLGIRSAAEVS